MRIRLAACSAVLGTLALAGTGPWTNARADTQEAVSSGLSVRADAPFQLGSSWYTDITVESSCVGVVLARACSAVETRLRYHYVYEGDLRLGGITHTVGPCTVVAGPCTFNLPVPSNALDWWVEAEQRRCVGVSPRQQCSLATDRAPEEGAYPAPS